MSNFIARADERMKKIDERIMRMEKFIAQKNKNRIRANNFIFISMYIVVVLMVMLATYASKADALYYNYIDQEREYCDIVWSEMHYGDALSLELEKEYRNRFI